MPYRPILRTLYALLILFPLVFLSCQKELTGDFIPPDPVTPPDLTTTVVVSQVSGFVTDGNNGAVVGASVSSGGQTVTTNKYGYFEFNNISVVKNAAVVSVSKPGFFPGIKTFTAQAGKGAFFRIKLIPKTNAGSFSAGTGASITISGGLNIAFPPNSIVLEGSNTPYSGTVNVSASWINPVAADLYGIMPGDLRGLDYADGPMQAVEGADALLIVTGWKEFRSPDFDAIKAALRHPVVIDGRSMYPPALPRAAGLEYAAIGRP